MPAMRAYVGLGANLGADAGELCAILRDALDLLGLAPGTVVVACSSFYLTAPVDAAGPDYVNAVAALDTTLDASSLLAVCLSIEQLHGRERPFHHAPRTLDLDLLMHGESSIDTTYLTLPHPRMHERAFVLAPLVEIAPDAVIPGQGRASQWLETVGGQRFSKIVE